MTDASEFDRPARGLRWSDENARDDLEAIVETLTDVTGFEVVGVSALRDDGYLHLLSLAGPAEARESLLDTLAPTDMLFESLRRADDWGVLQFVPHDRHDIDIDRWGWAADMSRDTVPGQWHPEDLLVAPLRGSDGTVLAVLGLDVPRDGRVPEGDRRAALEAFVRPACRAVVAILERERMAEQIRLADAAADIVRRASASMAAGQVLDSTAKAVTEGFRARSLWAQLFGDEPRPVHDPVPQPPPAEMTAALGRFTRAAWSTQTAGIIAPDHPPPSFMTEGERDGVLSFLADAGSESLLVAPLGAGNECVGWVALSRHAGDAEWSAGESAVALDIGRDLGQALVSARMFEHEHQLVEELKELADYKSRLVATVSHELRTPLTSIVGYLEMLESDSGLSDVSRRAIAAIQRGSVRLSQVVEDLLVLHRLADGHAESAGVVDIVPIARAAVDLNLGPATKRDITLTSELPDAGAPVLGPPHDLDHVVANLVSNAVKYTDDGGTVSVAVHTEGDDVVLTVVDTGIGIAPEQQEQVFEEFYRSPDPDASSRSGTGLGLAIVRRVVEGLGGRIELDSVLGAGSTFRVYLPAA